ncbi:hypothetical protein L596_030180 [Steinernema carpocapsae]|nr:hypothetical protein L596_030180 [Steinernema carpocapsae]
MTAHMRMATWEGRHVYVTTASPSRVPEFAVSFFGKTRLLVENLENSQEFKKYFVERYVRDGLIQQKPQVGKRLILNCERFEKTDKAMEITVSLECLMPGWAEYHVPKSNMDFDKVERNVTLKLTSKFRHDFRVFLLPLWNTEKPLTVFRPFGETMSPSSKNQRRLGALRLGS